MKNSWRWVRTGAVVAAAAATIIFSTPAQAQAAVGTLYLSPHTWIDPTQGCHRWPANDTVVTNHTDSPVSIYTGPECNTTPKTLWPGEQHSFDYMGSFYVHR
ncbi:hypothetical protein [Streptomyces rochei]|uniref:hypothetical protein n=1 Tax=Streptomyces rochei TaxID=1928 RepID=UPI00378FE61F